ncbi:hypothetical protein ACFY2N_34100 [Streptomyces rubiginosohelvolus]|uniref:hypothetical protein n=1 Tax=Streptomyces rubiginosohelvolus TaxID=67362 RepID=UPI00367A07DD
MDISTSSGLSVPELAAHLLRHANTQEERPPVALGPRYAPSATRSSAQALRKSIDAVSERLGPPALYGGNAFGPTIRWRASAHTVTLDAPGGARGGLQLSVRRTSALSALESERFQHAHELSIDDLPVLWQWQPVPVEPAPPSAPVAPNWAALRVSLEAVLRAWCDQLEDQLGNDDAGFDIVVHADGIPRRLVVLVSPADSLTVLVDDRDGAHDGVHHAEMRARGWQDFIAVHCWWGAYFERTPAGAGAAARLIMAELQGRGAESPRDLLLADVGAGEGDGLLTLPGLGIASAPTRRR